MLLLLRGGTYSKIRLSNLKTSRKIIAPIDSEVEFELCALYNLVYSALMPLELNRINIESFFSLFFRRLVLLLTALNIITLIGGALSMSLILIALPPSLLRGTRLPRTSLVARLVLDR